MSADAKIERPPYPKMDFLIVVGGAALASYGAILSGLGYLWKKHGLPSSLVKRRLFFTGAVLSGYGVLSGLTMTASGIYKLVKVKEWMDQQPKENSPVPSEFGFLPENPLSLAVCLPAAPFIWSLHLLGFDPQWQNSSKIAKQRIDAWKAVT